MKPFIYLFNFKFFVLSIVGKVHMPMFKAVRNSCHLEVFFRSQRHTSGVKVTFVW